MYRQIKLIEDNINLGESQGAAVIASEYGLATAIVMFVNETTDVPSANYVKIIDNLAELMVLDRDSISTAIRVMNNLINHQFKVSYGSLDNCMGVGDIISIGVRDAINTNYTYFKITHDHARSIITNFIGD